MSAYTMRQARAEFRRVKRTPDGAGLSFRIWARVRYLRGTVVGKLARVLGEVL